MQHGIVENLTNPGYMWVVELTDGFDVVSQGRNVEPRKAEVLLLGKNLEFYSKRQIYLQGFENERVMNLF